MITTLLLICALALSGVAAYYSIVGLIAIFAGAPISIAVMGSTLEASKLVIASWLYRNWRTIPIVMKTYLTTALVVLMMLTSMGIFGYLSKAHIEHGASVGTVATELAVYDQRIQVYNDTIEANRRLLKQLDDAVDQTMSRSTSEVGASRAVSLRQSQARERNRALATIEANQKNIAQLNEQAAPLRAQLKAVEAEVGPIKYIAALFYGDNPDANVLDKAVRWMIVLIVIVFDPLAVAMLIAANRSYAQQQRVDVNEPVTVQSAPEEVEETPPQQTEQPATIERETVDTQPHEDVQKPTATSVVDDGSTWRSRPHQL